MPSLVRIDALPAVDDKFDIQKNGSRVVRPLSPQPNARRRR
jgi:hypothetical protein